MDSGKTPADGRLASSADAGYRDVVVRPLPPALAGLPAAPSPRGWRLLAAWRVAARARGLLGVDDLPPDVGLWLRPARSVHTLGMRIAVDLVWLDGDGRPVRVDEAVRPWRHRACARAHAGVVEIAAGRGPALAAAIGAAGALDRPTRRGWRPSPQARSGAPGDGTRARVRLADDGAAP